MSQDRWINRWNVRGSKGDIYVVAVDADGNYGCSCPKWKFRRQECDHIRQIKDDETARVALSVKTTKKPEYVLARVRKPQYVEAENKLLIPLVPFNDKHLMEATIVYYMLKYGYSMSEIRERRGPCLPKDWTVEAILSHVRIYGEAEYPEDCMGAEKE